MTIKWWKFRFGNLAISCYRCDQITDYYTWYHFGYGVYKAGAGAVPPSRPAVLLWSLRQLSKVWRNWNTLRPQWSQPNPTATSFYIQDVFRRTGYTASKLTTVFGFGVCTVREKGLNLEDYTYRRVWGLFRA